ncbi:prepilin-type N-terminal cleavage/methylation domain-containing protein [uncultured Acinetobacter sp.]|uniref:type IV pilin protein n=1 Tax=uncultured Acinetobacter sp. TaxID=165433 RepID=UPI00259AB631|nr:prepilin-type N-terminal cleavage/methylation domain-containing protein [uncultured Acinetobacter sp.]
MVKKNGFTLVELMIVVAIVGILAAIAYPSYQQYVKKTKRTDMEANMLQVAAQIQRYKIANFRVSDATMADIGIATTYPIQGSPLYTLELQWIDDDGNVDTSSPLGSERWLLIATPIVTSTQHLDGHIALNYKGERCWTKGSDNSGTACTPSATSNWDGK